MKKIIILSSVLLVAIAVIAIKYFSELTGNTGNTAKILKYIPSDAALVLSFNNDESFDDIFKDYELFDAVIGEKRAAALNQLNSLLLKQPAVEEFTAGKKIFVSFHPEQADSVDLLFTMGVNEKTPKTDIIGALEHLEGIQLKETKQQDIYQLQLSTVGRPFFLFISNEAAAGSFSEQLLLRAVSAGKVKGESISNDFIAEISKSSGKDHSSPVDLFVNHHTLSSFFYSFIREKSIPGNSSFLLRNLKGFSSLGMNFKSDALMFNGISTPDTNATGYLNLFLDQHPIRNQLKTLLPENTANCLLFGLSDYAKFHGELEQYLHKTGKLKSLKEQVKYIRSSTGINIDNDIKSKLSNEFAVVETSNRNKIGIIKVTNGTAINFTLQLLSQPVSEAISRLNYSNILFYYFGDPFRSFTRPYFTVTDNYIIVGNSVSEVRQYEEDYQNNRFLAKTRDFMEHDQLVANNSNILLFIHNRNSAGVIRSVLKKGFAELFSDESYGLKDFYGLTWQWSAEGSHFQTNFYANYPSTVKKELKQLWSFKMNGRIASQPQTFRNGNRTIVLVQDNINNLYALSEKGQKLWTTQLDGKILGNIVQLDNGAFLFNTSKKLYLLNGNGYEVNGFPVDLPFNATSGASVTSADAEAKIFIAAGSRILGYKVTGEVLPGWNKDLNDRIIPGLRTASLNNTSYLIAGTEHGAFFFFNYNGTQAGKAVVPGGRIFKNSLAVSLGGNIKDSRIMTTDTAGIIYSVYFNGSVRTKSIGAWNQGLTFDFKDITGDGNTDYIFLDKTQLSVYNQDGTLVYTYVFEQPSENHLLLFTNGKGEYLTGVTSPEKELLFLFNKEGNLLRGFPVKGSGDFNLAYINNDGIRYLVYGTSDNYLHACKL